MRPGPYQITWIAVFDGGKALVFENQGFDDAVDLRLVNRFDNDNPPDREQTTDAPGRMPDAGSGAKDGGVDAQAAHGRSAMEQTDRHELEKLRFTDRFVDRLNVEAERKSFDRLVLIAAHRTLGEARERYSHRLTRRLLVEEAKDVVNEPADAIERRVQTILTGLPKAPARSHANLSGPGSRD